MVRAFEAEFGARPEAALFSGPGRTEIGGNHTDHQHGRVLCGSVDLDMLACAAPNGTDLVRIQSEGYPALEVDPAGSEGSGGGEEQLPRAGAGSGGPAGGAGLPSGGL